ncbi:sarcosine oxidase subunit beta [Halogranum rubrum]|uniref:Sarcosine oxidase subunit beta n=2 Tax=Halogranum rubrum TaxID=553466 RepID=A0A1I4GZ48_9EURY|nr:MULTISPECIES: FAD-binding oxidoreductase [Halogranum]EJN57671.1 FAD dependent oxidoreductase [Halogranum salarium B-1]SFL34810.1 sarcosine oxidase subunit beta [Halogranum rubrum]
MEALVIGGGIIGVATACHLAERDVDVTVIEKSHVGAGSTGRSGGGIRVQFSTSVNVELSLASKQVWDTFEDEFHTDIRRRRIGYLFLARTEETAEQLRRDVGMQNAFGATTELLTPEEAAEYCPKLYTDKFVAASYSASDEFVDPNLALTGYADRARELGVEFLVDEVVDIRVEDGAVVGVETPTRKLDAEYVVNAAGPWAGNVAAMAGVELPITPELHRLAFARPDEPLPEYVPLTIDLDSGAVFRPEEDDVAAIGGHFDDHPPADPDNFPQKIGLEWTMKALEGVADVCGYFGPDSAVTNGLTGLYAMTPDTNPIIEETLPGFVNAVGFSGHGFMHAPATGKLVAELIVDGEASLVDISTLSSDRFETASPSAEQNFI